MEYVFGFRVCRDTDEMGIMKYVRVGIQSFNVFMAICGLIFTVIRHLGARMGKAL